MFIFEVQQTGKEKVNPTGNGAGKIKQRIAPISEKAALKRAYVLLDGLSSTTTDKDNIADNKLALLDKEVNAATERYLKTLAEKGEDSAQTKQQKAERDFLEQMFTFIQMQAMKFISIRNAFNKDKENLQSFYESMINAPKWYELLQKSLPWLAAGFVFTGAKTIGSAIWGAIASSIQQHFFPDSNPQVVQDGLDIAGIGSLAALSVWMNKRSTKKKKEYEQTCEMEKRKVDANEEDVKKSALKLISLEIRRLMGSYGYQDIELGNEEVATQSKKIISDVKTKYGFVLPYIDGDAQDEQAAKAPEPQPVQTPMAWIKKISGSVSGFIRRLAILNGARKDAAPLPQDEKKQ